MNTIRDTKVEWQVRLPLNSIRVDPAIQQRAAGTSQDIVDEYAEAMRNGAEFPAIDVFNNGDGGFNLANGFDLANGFHQLKAYRLAHPDANDIECKVHLGNRDDAILFACGANAQHGLRRSRSDKLKAVTTLIHSERWSGWSDREIARQCGVSHTYVAAVRSERVATLPDAGPQEQEAAAETPPADDPSATEASGARPVRRRTARRGDRRYNMDTERIGRGGSRPRDEVAKLKRAFERFQKALDGASEPARQTFVEHCREEIMAIAITPEPSNPEPPDPEAANPEPPSPAEVESSTVPPGGARAYGVGKPSRLTRGSAPNKSHKNAPGRHRFSSDNQPPKSKRGRPKGSMNKYSRNLREDLMEATERVGRDGEGQDGVVGYLMWLARAEPKSYAMLLRGMMPAEIRATMTLKPMLTLEEAFAEVRARGLRPELIEHLLKVDDELGPDDEPNPYDHGVIDLKPEPAAEGA
jgi:hypothetical protein